MITKNEYEDNPRFSIQDTSIERTFRFMEIVEEGYGLDEGVKDVLLLLDDCFPSGGQREVRGASLKQLMYIATLAGFEVEQARELCRVFDKAGGMDSGQAHHIITKLKEARRTPTASK